MGKFTEMNMAGYERAEAINIMGLPSIVNEFMDNVVEIAHQRENPVHMSIDTNDGIFRHISYTTFYPDDLYKTLTTLYQPNENGKLGVFGAGLGKCVRSMIMRGKEHVGKGKVWTIVDNVKSTYQLYLFPYERPNFVTRDWLVKRLGKVEGERIHNNYRGGLFVCDVIEEGCISIGNEFGIEIEREHLNIRGAKSNTNTIIDEINFTYPVGCNVVAKINGEIVQYSEPYKKEEYVENITHCENGMTIYTRVLYPGTKLFSPVNRLPRIAGDTVVVCGSDGTPIRRIGSKNKTLLGNAPQTYDNRLIREIHVTTEQLKQEGLVNPEKSTFMLEEDKLSEVFADELDKTTKWANKQYNSLYGVDDTLVKDFTKHQLTELENEFIKSSHGIFKDKKRYGFSSQKSLNELLKENISHKDINNTKEKSKNNKRPWFEVINDKTSPAYKYEWRGDGGHYKLSVVANQSASQNRDLSHRVMMVQVKVHLLFISKHGIDLVNDIYKNSGTSYTMDDIQYSMDEVLSN